MAKSKLIAGRSKKSTVLVSVRTIQEAINRANMAVEHLMETNPNDPQIEQVEDAVAHMSRILKANPQQMKQDGVSSISDYMDDAVKPEEARKLKNEVDMILKMNRQQRNPGQQVNYVPNSAVAEHGIAASKKQADGGAAFSTDRDEKGEAKAPEKIEVPRVAKKKKEAVPEEPMAAAPAPVPAPEPVPAPAAAGGNPIDFIPTETLIKVIGDLPKEDDFAQNKGKQDAVVQLTEILKSRPVLPPEQAEGAAPAPAAVPPAPAIPAPVAASAKKAELGDHAVSEGGSSSSSPSISPSSSRPSANPAPAAPKQAPATPEKATVGFGGLSVAALDEEKTADDYRIQDYKLTGEGVRPTGKKPDLYEQEEQGVPGSVDFPNPAWTDEPQPVSASVDKTAVTPPGISEELMHKLKKQYPGEKDKAYATAWKIHNDKEASLKVIAAEVEKIANAYGGGWFSGSGKPMEVDEDGGRTPEIAEAHSKLEDNTGISRPETTLPIKLNKQAAEKTTGKAVKESEQIGNDLKKMYLDAKSLTSVNDTRAVREAVEAIFRAADMFDEATKTLSKQHQQEESEAAAAVVREKTKGKKSSFEGLALAAAAE
jgi:hypothetical protein